MERKVGEIFEYEGKVYQVVKSNSCTDCAFKNMSCSFRRSNLGHCVIGSRTDKVSIIFKEVKKYMDIKNNQLTINIPEGMEIDIQNSNLKAGVIKFKKKEIDYLDVCTSLGSDTKLLPITATNCEKVKAIDKLIDIANYYNKGWKPDWNNREENKYYIRLYKNTNENDYEIGYRFEINHGIIFFKNKEDAQAVIDNPNFREILDTIYKD